MKKKLIYVVDDELAIRRLLEHWLKIKWGYDLQEFSDAESCLEALDGYPDLVILDIMLPGMSGIDLLKEIKSRYPDLPVIMLSAQGQIEVAVEALKLGAIDYFTKTIDLTKLEYAVRNALEMYTLKREVSELRDVIKTNQFSLIVTNDSAMAPVLRFVEKAKESTISVLIQGESGTGKEVIARTLHYEGNRRDKPFVAVNCAAIPRDLLESEMFGHEEGAFTGATSRKIGKFEQADGGTLFLDDVSEMDINIQAKFLRALQERQFERVGGTETLTADVHIISATNRDLMQAVRERTFREDLYYRLAAFPIKLPPLRERRSDVLLLSEHFLNKFSKREGKTIRGFEKRALKRLQNYPWPGNVRELESGIERAVLLCEEEVIRLEDLPVTVQSYGERKHSDVPFASVFDTINSIVPLEILKEQAVRHALNVSEGNISEAAQQLKISRSTMYEMIKKYHINEEDKVE